MGSLGVQELVVILLIVLVLFGARKLPELSRSIGESIKEFRKATDETDADATDPDESGEQPRATVSPPSNREN